jgi:hypothetical protein
MKNLNGLKKPRYEKRIQLLRACVPFLLVMTTIFAAGIRPALAQVVEDARAQHASLWAGGGASGFYLQYGDQKALGFTAFVEGDTARNFGIVAEGRWLEYHQFNDVHAETYLIGPRYQFHINRFEPYAKGLVGFGDFNFPYNYAHGRYFVVGGGGGVDFRLGRRWSVRLADIEYQDWPQFTFGPMTSVGISSGIRYRIFR